MKVRILYHPRCLHTSIVCIALLSTSDVSSLPALACSCVFLLCLGISLVSHLTLLILGSCWITSFFFAGFSAIPSYYILFFFYCLRYTIFVSLTLSFSIFSRTSSPFSLASFLFNSLLFSLIALRFCCFNLLFFA